MLDLKSQLTEYLDHVVERIDADDVLAHRLQADRVRPVPVPVSARARSRGLKYAAAAAVLVLVLVGGIAWLSALGGSPDVQTPTSATVAPTVPTTTAGPDDAGPPGNRELTVTDVVQVAGSIPPKLWATDRIMAVGGAVWVGVDNRDPDDLDVTLPSSLFRIDPETRAVADEILLPAGVIDLVADETSLWALAADDTVVRIDLASRRVVQTIETSAGIGGGGSNLRSDLVFADEALWVAGGDGVVARIDPDSSAIETFSLTYRDGPLPVDMWIGEVDGALWGLNSHNSVLVRFDLASKAVSQHDVDGRFAESYAVAGEGAIWLSGHVRFDTESLESDRLGSSGGWPAVLVGGGLWTIDGGFFRGTHPGSLTRLDIASGEVTDVLSILADDAFDGHLSLIASHDGALWVADERNGVLMRIDSQTRQLTHTIDIGHGGELLAFGGAIWIASEDGTITRVGAAD